MYKTVLRELVQKYNSRKKLSEADLRNSIKLISEGKMQNTQIILFLKKIRHKTTNDERALMALEMVKQGRKSPLFHPKPSHLLFDKHGVGGVPGDSSALVVVPLCAKLGLTIPKVSTSAITTAAGQADIMNVISEVDLGPNEAAKVLKKCNGFLLWSGGKLGITPADSRIVSVQHESLFDFDDIFVPSILAKKKAIGSNVVAIDIPWGTYCKIPTCKRAREIKASFIEVGRQLGIVAIPLIFHENEPSGRFSGPALQAREVLTALKNRDTRPRFVEKALIIVSHLLSYSSGKSIEICYELARQLILNGNAFLKLEEIANTQGRRLREFEPQGIPMPTCSKPMISLNSGIVRRINMKNINQWASILAGNGTLSKSNAGLQCHVRLHEKVMKGDVLMTFYAPCEESLNIVPEDDRQADIFKIA